MKSCIRRVLPRAATGFVDANLRVEDGVIQKFGGDEVGLRDHQVLVAQATVVEE